MCGKSREEGSWAARAPLDHRGAGEEQGSESPTPLTLDSGFRLCSQETVPSLPFRKEANTPLAQLSLLAGLDSNEEHALWEWGGRRMELLMCPGLLAAPEAACSLQGPLSAWPELLMPTEPPHLSTRGSQGVLTEAAPRSHPGRLWWEQLPPPFPGALGLGQLRGWGGKVGHLAGTCGDSGEGPALRYSFKPCLSP